jgi:hypothetical protein
MSDLRDYIAEAESFLKPPKGLREMYAEDPQFTVAMLVKHARESGTMIRKAAVYALGQLGDETALPQLQAQLSAEDAAGVRDAIKAAIAGIELASVTKGASETDRQRIIANVYDGRDPHAKPGEMPRTAPVASASKGGCLSVVLLIAVPVGIAVARSLQ